MVIVPLPLLLFYAYIYGRVSYRHKNYGEVWNLIGRVIRQNYRKNIRFILSPALYIMVGVLWVCYSFMMVEFLVNEYTWWRYVTFIVALTAILLGLLAQVFSKVIIREIEKLC
ncbi:MAG: hypothetical protein KIH09_01845 [Candidatus Freyarchaeota archaeon]|nr:hypothetical protein [Candidatus Jordarchaeia archaeon]